MKTFRTIFGAAVETMAVALGAMLIAASVLADWLPGAASSAFGWKQVLACMTGIALLAAGLLPKTRWRGSATAVRWLIAIWLAVTSFALSRVAPVLAASWASWVLLGYAAAICALIPLRVGILVFIGLLVLHLTLTAVSRVKIDLTGMPLTMLDVRIALDNPQGLWDALSLPTGPSMHSTCCSSLRCCTSLSSASRRCAISSRNGSIANGFSTSRVGRWRHAQCFCWCPSTSMCCMQPWRGTVRRGISVASCASTGGSVYCRFLHIHVTSSRGGLVTSSGRISPGHRPPRMRFEIPYCAMLAFLPALRNRQIDRTSLWFWRNRPSIRTGRSVYREPGTTDYFCRVRGRSRRAPEGQSCRGGTWITEFETITGLDSRLFGYAGWYTHASLSPFVERSFFASHLRKRGYRTSAFFPHRADFYNARRAYARYGFESMADSDDLGSDVQINDDVEMAERVVKSLGASPAAPFFAYVLFIGNHFPHECNAEDSGGFTARFLDSDDFTVNCELNVYLQRLDSTTHAVGAFEEYLADIETRTGRPYVLLVFGDHQPASFTGSRSAVVRDYRPYRRSPDLHMTFFRIQTSMPGRLTCCEPAPPATVLPTLLSAFVADRPEDIYLGENLWLYERCGSDAIGMSTSTA